MVDRFAARPPAHPFTSSTRTRGCCSRRLLRLLDAGVGLEAHLQNSIPIFLDGVPHRIAFRDFAGLRLHLPRLAERGVDAARCGPAR